jgi:hypothetical protein
MIMNKSTIIFFINYKKFMLGIFRSTDIRFTGLCAKLGKHDSLTHYGKKPSCTIVLLNNASYSILIWNTSVFFQYRSWKQFLYINLMLGIVRSAGIRFTGLCAKLGKPVSITCYWKKPSCKIVFLNNASYSILIWNTAVVFQYMLWKLFWYNCRLLHMYELLEQDR